MRGSPQRHPLGALRWPLATDACCADHRQEPAHLCMSPKTVGKMRAALTLELRSS